MAHTETRMTSFFSLRRRFSRARKGVAFCRTNPKRPFTTKCRLPLVLLGSCGAFCCTRESRTSVVRVQAGRNLPSASGDFDQEALLDVGPKNDATAAQLDNAQIVWIADAEFDHWGARTMARMEVL